MLMNSYRIGLIVPTLNAGSLWQNWLSAVNQQSLQPHRKLVVDSSSTDHTPQLARQNGFEVITIDRGNFNHGGTRHMAAEYLTDCDILIYLTQDALLVSPDSIANLVASFENPLVAVAYGRQLPHHGAGPIGVHARLYNYSGESQLRTKADIPTLGFKTIFCSNSFAAYRRIDYMSMGGFKNDLIFGEDAHIAARLIVEGKAVYYNADAQVYHSHDYSIVEDICRYFDIGVFHARDHWMIDKFGATSGEGFRFVGSENRYLIAHAWYMVPSAVIRTFCKYAGYRLGKLEAFLPLKLKRTLSMNSRFWK